MTKFQDDYENNLKSMFNSEDQKVLQEMFNMKDNQLFELYGSFVELGFNKEKLVEGLKKIIAGVQKKEAPKNEQKPEVDSLPANRIPLMSMPVKVVQTNSNPTSPTNADQDKPTASQGFPKVIDNYSKPNSSDLVGETPGFKSKLNIDALKFDSAKNITYSSQEQSPAKFFETGSFTALLVNFVLQNEQLGKKIIEKFVDYIEKGEIEVLAR